MDAGGAVGNMTATEGNATATGAAELWDSSRTVLVVVFGGGFALVCCCYLLMCQWIVHQGDEWQGTWFCRSEEWGCLDPSSCYSLAALKMYCRSSDDTCSDITHSDQLDDAHELEEAPPPRAGHLAQSAFPRDDDDNGDDAVRFDMDVSDPIDAPPAERQGHEGLDIEAVGVVMSDVEEDDVGDAGHAPNPLPDRHTLARHTSSRTSGSLRCSPATVGFAPTASGMALGIEPNGYMDVSPLTTSLGLTVGEGPTRHDSQPATPLAMMGSQVPEAARFPVASPRSTPAPSQDTAASPSPPPASPAGERGTPASEPNSTESQISTA
eukprot:TRINITY_DN12374_c0_g1_i3.p1 TRINITY_DN12374_c0_g1~~TRINITY_DN12374_c0_g1_i3.p1  ORF type:complete len:324 (+),score=63.22 TRINITY_DN12374_c0_g1_i3:129-1100(+)